MDQNILEIIKVLRNETRISMGLCSEAAKESLGDIEKARLILKEKCRQQGKKFYKNPSRPLGHFLNFYHEEDNVFVNIKFGVESEFLANSVDLHDFVHRLISKENFMDFMLNNEEFLDEELLYLSGMLKENIQILAYNILRKTSDQKFIVHKKGSTPNEKVLTGLTVAVVSKLLEDEMRRNFLINMGALMNKKINNLIHEKNPHINYMYKVTSPEIEVFLNTPSVTNKEITIKELIEDTLIYDILGF